MHDLVSTERVPLNHLQIAIVELDGIALFDHRLQDLLRSLIPIAGLLGLLKLLLQLLNLPLVVVLNLPLELLRISRCSDFGLRAPSLRAGLQAVEGVATIFWVGRTKS